MGKVKRGAALAVVLAGLVLLGALGMRKLRWKTESRWNPFLESTEYLANEERGFYTMTGLKVTEDPSRQQGLAPVSEGETLELIQIHLGEYSQGPVGPAGLAQIRQALESRRNSGCRLILRFLYDWEGKGLESDPVSRRVVITHMEQMGKLLEDYQDLVYLVQGVFVGSWAEMHHSRYLTPESYTILIETMDRVIPEGIFLGVRTPSYWRMAAGRKEPTTRQEAREGNSLLSRLSLFNDGMLGNSLDCGTYGEVEREDSRLLTDRWTREDELAFQNQLNRYLPNGGEVVLDNPCNDFPAAPQTLKTIHVSYLNRDHDLAVLTKWKEQVYTGADTVYNGISQYDYIERHLGYRFVLRQADLETGGWGWEEPILRLTLENVGFASRYTPCQAWILLRREGKEEERIPLDTDVRDWLPGQKIRLEVGLDLEPGVEYQISLLVTGKASGRPVLFANEEITQQDGSCLLGWVERKGG